MARRAERRRGQGEQRELPLFPLKTVLFPGSSLPLHVFEQRYREMIGQCLSTPRQEFAVLLIKEGDEVVERPGEDEPAGQPASPCEVGTTVRIVDATQFDDGRYYLVCLGQERVRLRRLVQETPYLVGVVEAVVDDDAGDDDASLRELADHVRGATTRLLEAIEQALPPRRETQRQQIRRVARAIPADLVGLSFFVPRTLSAASAGEKQRLLELPTVRERLREELPLLVREQQFVGELKALGTARPDGAGTDAQDDRWLGAERRLGQPWRLN